tara:strand:- start:864 stop:1118 length:255 start_codon:yes stop_codon:yes gene_type:complete
MIKIDPHKFGLSKRTVLYKEKNKILITAKRKSRIIMKDGLRLVQIAEKIKKSNKEQKVALFTNAPICSKTKSFLIKNRISILDI